MPNRAVLGVVALLLGQAWPVAGGAASPIGELPQPLHLDQALRHALEYNLSIQQAHQQVGIRRGQRSHAARIVPTNPELRLFTGRRQGERETTTDLSIRVAQTLFTGGKRDLGIAAAKARVGSARARLAFLQTTIAARTRRAFLDLLVAREAVATAERVLGIARDFQAYARDRLKAGEATRLETNTARKELALSERQLIPNLTVFGFYRRREGTDTVLGGGISVPIPSLHRFSGEQEAASARLRQAQLEKDALRITVRREVTQALAEYRGARKRLNALKGAVLKNAECNLALTQQALRAGEVGVPAVTAARNNLLNVRWDYLHALGALVTAATDLERATGGLIALGPQPGQAAGDPTETSYDAN